MELKEASLPNPDPDPDPDPDLGPKPDPDPDPGLQVGPEQTLQPPPLRVPAQHGWGECVDSGWAGVSALVLCTCPQG